MMAFGKGGGERQQLDVESILRESYSDKPFKSDEHIYWKEKPTISLSSNDEVLYISQRELAVVDPLSIGNIQFIASDSATTCHIAVLLQTELKVVGLAHFDDCGVEQGISDLLDLMETRCDAMSQSNYQLPADGVTPNRYDLILFGGFKDSRCLSQKLSEKLLELFCNSSRELNMKTVCIGHTNTNSHGAKHYPVVTGVAVNCRTLEVIKVKCRDQGPDLQIRSCRNFVGPPEMKRVYDNESKEFFIEPFDFEPFPNIDLWLQQSDTFLLQHMSTSPDQEEDDFVSSMRATLRCIHEHSEEPMVTLFSGGNARRYNLSPNGWVRSHTNSLQTNSSIYSNMSTTAQTM